MVAALVVAGGLLAACPSDDDDPGPSASSTSTPTVDGGSVRVGVWAPPDVDQPHLGGAAVRALVLPQLFVAEPDGSWRPSLVDPKSDRTAGDERSATFKLRPGAKWSDGSPITAEDLRRTRDERVVAGVDGPDAGGTITVRFSVPQPGWRRLWSGIDSIAAPAAGVWGGPFLVSSAAPGLETVLARNPTWYGEEKARLDEIRLQLVPDPLTARQLLAAGELDVLMPPAYLARTRQLRDVAGVEVAAAKQSGWWMGMTISPKLHVDRRRSIVATVDRAAFVGTLLAGEATLLQTFGPTKPATWASTGPGDVAGLRGATIDLVAMAEEPMSSTLNRSMQKRLADNGGRFELRVGEFDRVSGWLLDGSYDAVLALNYDGPDVCWSCRWSAVDSPLAERADAGDEEAVAALETRLRDDALLLPLWRPTTIVAWRRAAVAGVDANGYGLSAAWNAWEWAKPSS